MYIAIAIIIILMALPDHLPTLAFWPLTLFLSLKYGFRKLNPSDWRRAHPTELAQLLMIGGPIYLAISFVLASGLSFIDEDISYPNFDASSYLAIVPGVLIAVAVMSLIRYFKRYETENQSSGESNGSGYRNISYDEWVKMGDKSKRADPYLSLVTALQMTKEELLRTPSDYTYKRIPKKSGGVRTLSIPNADLKNVQVHLAGIFNKEFDRAIHHCCHAYRKDRSIFTNSVPHLGCEVLIKLDIKNYFGTIDVGHVRKAFQNLSEKRATQSSYRHYFPSDNVLKSIIKLLVNEHGLPQGAPTSSFLANIVLADFDHEVFLFTRSMDARYTRYSDDLTISLKIDDTQKIAQVIKFIESKLTDYGFRMNKKKGKIQVLRKHQAQRICGITINSGQPTISRKQRKIIRAAYYNHKEGKDISFSQNQLNGHASFQSYIGLRGKRLKEKLNHKGRE